MYVEIIMVRGQMLRVMSVLESYLCHFCISNIRIRSAMLQILADMSIQTSRGVIPFVDAMGVGCVFCAPY